MILGPLQMGTPGPVSQQIWKPVSYRITSPPEKRPPGTEYDIETHPPVLKHVREVGR